MTVVARYAIPPGTEMMLLARPVVVTGQDDQGYKMVGREDGVTTVVPFAKMVDYLKLPGATINTALPATGDRLKHRLGGYATSEALSEDQREVARFHLAVCEGMRAYRSKVRIERGDPSFELSERIADQPAAREFVAGFATQILGQKILTKLERGGKTGGLVLYRGRTLME